MLDWLKRKPAPAPSGQLLESENQKPLTDERLGRLLGRLGPDSRTRGEAVPETANKTHPLPTTNNITVESPAAEAGNADHRSPSTGRRTRGLGGPPPHGRTQTHPGHGPPA